MRVASIDCGTNTLLCLVAEVTPGAGPAGVRAIEDHAEIVRLGEGLDRTGRLKPEAIARACEALAQHLGHARRLGCDRALAVGTEALRRAENGGDFVREADALLAPFGAHLEVIDGQREARLSWDAVAGSFPAGLGERTVVDIGGGSTEILVGEDEVRAAVSLPIGSVRLTERLLAHDPPTPDEQARLIETIDRALDGAPPPRGRLVGIAGTVTTLAAMSLGLPAYDAERVHGLALPAAEIRRLLRLLASAPLAERRRLPGLDPRRADVIYAGAMILDRVVARLGADACLVSDRGIRWGLVYERARTAAR